MIVSRIDRSSRYLGLIALMFAVSNSHGADIAKHVVRTRVAGIDLIVYRTDIKDVVTILGALPAGDAFATNNAAVARLAGALLDKGTASMDKFAIAKQLGQTGAQLRFTVEAQAVTMQGRSLTADLPRVLTILADELRHPAFREEEFDKAKIELLGDLQQKSENTEFRAEETLSRAMFPPGHPNRQASLEEWRDAIDRARLADVKEFYGKTYGPAHMVLVLVGDLDISQVQAEVAKYFHGWSGGVPYLTASKTLVPNASDQLVSLAGKTSVTLLMGEATGLRYQDADSLPLRAGVAILGNGFTSRLMGTVRDKEGLTYHIVASVDDDSFDDGDWRINASFAPALLDRGLSSVHRELERWWQDGINADELKSRKTNMIGSFQVGLSTTGGLAATLLHTVQRGLPLSWIDEYTKSVDTLTLEQVNGAIRRYVDPHKLNIVEAGSVMAAPAQPTALRGRDQNL
jgi:zinc protease